MRRNVLGGGTPTMSRPRKAESPPPKMVSARPRDDLVGAKTDAQQRVDGRHRRARDQRRRAPTQALPVQMQAPTPARAPISMIPSMPRLRTPARSVISSPRQAKRMAVPAATAAASTETMNAGVRISVMAQAASDGVTARRQDESWSWVGVVEGW